MQSKYNALGLYNDATDPRLIVPKHNPLMGWTINIGHKYGRLSIIAILAAIGLSVIATIIAANR